MLILKSSRLLAKYTSALDSLQLRIQQQGFAKERPGYDEQLWESHIKSNLDAVRATRETYVCYTGKLPA